MKNLFKTLIAVAVISVSVSSCKKGEDDPGLSLSSRTSRFAGEWTVDKWDANTTTESNDNASTDPTIVTTITKTSIDGAVYSNTEDETQKQSTFSYNTKTTNSGTVSSFTYTIEKDGTWSSKMVTKVTSETVVDASGTTTSALDITTTTEANGTWQFLGKNKGLELKNKEAVSLSTEKITTSKVSVSTTAGGGTVSSTSTETYAPNEMVEVWTLSKLAKKEMVGNIAIDNSTSGSVTYPNGSGTSTNKYSTVTEKGTVVITFTQK